ncbi:flagellar hook-length control protein FliK [Alteromonas sp. ASW11-19]|uniref:Flagellar hook-length control protein FliK n=1 Tax=Alteromonas salexigens TaxID=2982530 RepID=A0ABT2VNK4_9ALTE|nr:flagellar hook-length control protein FliK [Alteromonas salexigens]MCU7554883.1 flagellar hook-length control protein FliK [Alteromonas salexigens]
MNIQIPDIASLTTSRQNVASLTADKLAQAASLATAAKITIARLPEHVLRIGVPSAGASLKLDVKAPATLPVPDKAYIARTSQQPNTGVILSQQQTQTEQPLSPKLEAALTRHVTKAISAQPATQFSVTTTVAAVSSGAIELHVKGESRAPALRLPLSETSHTLKPGDPVTVKASINSKGNWSVTLTPDQPRLNSGLQAAPPTFNLKPSAITPPVIDSVVNARLHQQGLIVTTKEGSAPPPALKALLNPGPVTGVRSPAVATASNIQIHQSTATASRVQLHPVASLTLPATSNAESALPMLSKAVLPETSFTKLPRLQQIGDISQPSKQATVTGQGTSDTPPRFNLSGEEQRNVHQQIIALSRQLLKDTGSTREALVLLVQNLKNAQGSVSPASQPAVAKLLSSLQAMTPMPALPGAGEVEGNKDSAGQLSANPRSPLPQQLQALFASPTLPLTATQLMNPATSNSMVAGLVALLHVTLAGRAINRQPGLQTQADAPDQMLHKLVGGGGGAQGKPAAGRVSQELAQFESRNPFIQQIKTLLANHQQHKLAQVDSRLQGQESLFYVLPVTAEKGSPPEILIRPEERGGHAARKQGENGKLWNVTMKLDIGNQGELLAKSRIDNESITLDLYTSTDTLLVSVLDTLPYLKRRLTELGLEVAGASCQRGKIPATLNERPYHIFETQA